MLAVNTLLQDRYRIISPLGHGGMGAVYKAIDERFGEPIALKEILIELTNSNNEKQKDLVIKAFEREAKALAKASHEVVPYVRDYFTELDRQFLVMELVEGKDLAEMLEQNNTPFSLKDSLKWLDQLLDALDYLHNLQPQIIHRDIKPQNLKLNFRRKIKLLDFGIAKSADNATSTITNQTFVGATLNYSPIEQILRVIDPTFREFIILKHKEEAGKVLSQSTDTRCDIYSLGATFYHLLTNHLPENVVKRTVEIWSDNADPLVNPTELNTEIPAPIAQCLLKAMEVERDNRYSSAFEMREALQKVIKAEKRSKQTGNVTALAEQRRLQIEKEEIKLQQQRLMQAETDKLVGGGNEIKIQTQNEVSFDTQNSSSELSKPQHFNTQPSVSKSSFTEPLPVDVSITQPTGSISKTEVTGTGHFDQMLLEKNQTSAQSMIFGDAEPKLRVKTLWILPIAALGILTISGISGFVLMNNLGPTDPNKPVPNVVISTPTATPAITPTVAPIISPTPLPTQSKPNETSEKRRIYEKAKPSVVPTPNKTPIQIPVKTPLPQGKIPKPKPQKQNISDDCIYNGRCN